MATQIIEFRAKNGLLPLPCVALRGITGQYWRFQNEGHAAVSTIEAIAHTASAAGLSPNLVEDLLTLFFLQKLRVMQRVNSGGKVPRAIEVCGTGQGSWKEITLSVDKI
jgi:hypothetical protein